MNGIQECSTRKKEITNKDVLKWIATQTLLPRRQTLNSIIQIQAMSYSPKWWKKSPESGSPTCLKKSCFGPFGMKDTYVFDEVSRFSPDAPEIVNHAKCYNHVSGQGFVPVGYTPMNFITGDGNVHSTIVDLAIWESLLARARRSVGQYELWRASGTFVVAGQAQESQAGELWLRAGICLAISMRSQSKG